MSVDPAHEKKSQISLFASSDCGGTWSEISVIDSAGGLGEGVWEPHLIYDGGFLYCFYSDDSDEVYSQTVVLKKSGDLVSWSEKIPVVTPDSPEDRPGMPVVTKLGSENYFLCYEYGTGGEYPVYCKTTDSIESWKGAGKKIVTKSGDSLGSAPYCLWLPAGGDNGTLIGKYGSRIKNDLFVSFDCGESFSAMSNPLDYPDKPGFGYHPCFCCSENGERLYYANAVDYTGELSKISFVSLSLKRNPVREARDKLKK